MSQRTWGEWAQVILDAAASSGVQVDRKLVRPGPFAALDCSMIAVTLLSARLEVVDPTPGIPRELCAMVPVATFSVLYAADCVPAVDAAGRAPSAEAITAWSRAFQDNAERVWLATVDGLAVEEAKVGDATFAGPQGGMASTRFEVRVSSLG